jgi:DNA-binding response OmpR family regulator
MRILVADDDAAIVESIQLVLEDEGYEVIPVLEGSDVMEQSQQLPDAILLDIWMSGSNGGEIAKELKAREATKMIPVILVSANKDCADIATAAGADDYLAKPFNIDELIAKVEKHTARRSN